MRVCLCSLTSNTIYQHHSDHTSPLSCFRDSAAAHTHVYTRSFTYSPWRSCLDLSTYVQLQHLSTGFCQRLSYKPSTLDACFRALMSPTRRLFSTCPLFILQVGLYILNLSNVWPICQKSNIAADLLAKAFNARGCTVLSYSTRCRFRPLNSEIL